MFRLFVQISPILRLVSVGLASLHFNLIRLTNDITSFVSRRADKSSAEHRKLTTEPSSVCVVSQRRRSADSCMRKRMHFHFGATNAHETINQLQYHDCGRRPKSGFTLVELLVVIAILGVLLGLLLPAVQAAREAARRNTCVDKIRQIGIAAMNYHGEQNSFPPGSRKHRLANEVGISLQVMLLPYLELQTLYDEIRPNSDGGCANFAPRLQAIDAFTCPSAPEPDDQWKPSHYVGVSGANTNEDVWVLFKAVCGDIDINGVFYPESYSTIGQISDGTSNTLAIGERVYAFQDWMTGSEWMMAESFPLQICSVSSKNVRYPINADLDVYGYYKHDPHAPSDATIMLFNDLPFGSEHPGGAQFCYADGSVHFLVDSINFDVLQAMATRNGEEPAAAE